MPIKIADGLSAKEKLHEEGIFTIDKGMALHQDIRPLRILILNLMPLKKPTELQLLRLLGDSPLQVEVDFCHTETHESTHTDPSYLEENYYVFDEIKDNYYDGLIITGAPVEQIPFESVDYWPEMKTYFEWAKTHAFSTLHFCWGAQAALYYYYGIEKRLLPAKLFGIFEYQLTQKHHPLLRGFDDRYFIPQSRHTAINDIQVYNTPQLDILSRSVENGINIIGTPDHRRSSSVTSSTTGGPWKRNTCGIRKRACPLQCPRTTIRMTTIRRGHISRGAATPTCSIITG